MAPPEVLTEFREDDAREVARWPTSIEEVRLWAGSAGGWPVEASVFRRWHAEPGVNPYVLDDGDRLTGYGELWIDGAEQEVELARIIVNPASRGRGVGRRLVLLLLERASLSGLPDAFVRVVPENGAALACYRGAGFSSVPDSQREEFNRGQPVDYVWMKPSSGLKPPALRWMMQRCSKAISLTWSHERDARSNRSLPRSQAEEISRGGFCVTARTPA